MSDKHKPVQAGERPRLIAHVYFYYNRTLVSQVPLYSGESSGSDAPMLRALDRTAPIDRDHISRKLLLSKRIIIPTRTFPHPVVYNGGLPLISDDSGRK